MRKVRGFGSFLACAFVLLGGGRDSRADGGELSPWTVERSIAVRYFVATQVDAANQLIETGEPVIWSPDRQHLFVVSRSGDLACECNVYELNVFSRAQILRALETQASQTRPLASLTLRSGTNYPAITGAHWDETGSSVIFTGLGSVQGKPQVYRLDISSRSTKRLTDAPEGVEEFSVAADSVIYRSLEAAEQLPSHNQYPATLITQDVLFKALQGIKHRWRYALYSAYRAEPPKRILSLASGVLPGAWLAPNGKWGVVATSSPGWSVPEKWHAYGGAQDPTHLPDAWRLARFAFIDLEAGMVRPILDAPWGIATQTTDAGTPVQPSVLGSSDSTHAVLVSTALPLTSGDDDLRRTPYLVDFEPATFRWRPLEKLERAHANEAFVKDVSWAVRGSAFVVTSANDAGQETRSEYRFNGSRWIRRNLGGRDRARDAAGRGGTADLAVFVRESANDPPVLIAAVKGREVVLSKADPALRGVWLARAESVQWREPDGVVAKGLLMLPRDHDASAPPPVVVQAYHYLPNVFRPDGPHTTAYAAQALVARGMAVLQIDIPGVVDRPSAAETPREGAAFVERIDASIAELARRRLVDPTRVGLVGFSRAGYQTYYAITHPGRVQIGAAVDGDGWTGDYNDYLLTEVLGGGREGFEKVNGGKSFWRDKSAWLLNSNEFNVDRVTAPLLYTTNTREASLLPLTMFSAFSMNGRPLEIINFPAGAHPLRRPAERLASLNATVDWMSFWLQGAAVANSAADPERSVRWMEMRRQREHLLRKEHTERGDPATTLQ